MIVTTRPLCLSLGEPSAAGMRLASRRRAVLLALYRLGRPKPYGLGYSPSVREIMREIGGLSTSTAWRALVALSLMGLVTRSEHRCRGAKDAGNWHPNMERLQYITVAGVTTVSERT